MVASVCSLLTGRLRRATLIVSASASAPGASERRPSEALLFLLLRTAMGISQSELPMLVEHVAFIFGGTV
jgi:hypothetical protein